MVYSIMSNQPYIFSRVTAHDVISLIPLKLFHHHHHHHLCMCCRCICPSLSETAAESRSPIIGSIVAPNLKCAWHWNQTQPPTPQVLPWLLIAILRHNFLRLSFMLKLNWRRRNWWSYINNNEVPADDQKLLSASCSCHSAAIYIQNKTYEKLIN